MSATDQNHFYLVGKQREGATVNTMTRERYEQALRNAERFMPKERKNESTARNTR